MSNEMKCIECGTATTNGYMFCKSCFRKLRNNNVIVECEDCGTWHFMGKPCLCEMLLVQCPNCGCWYYYEDTCFCTRFNKAEADKPKYQKKSGGLLSPAELLFKRKLEQVVDLQKYEINKQTPLRQLVRKEKEWQWANELHKYIDFCICKKEDSVVVLCIEYDDSTHEQPARRERDKKVDEIVTEAGFKIIHIKRDDEMSLDYLRGRIEEYL
jgi:hypothetical protein